MWVIVVDPPLQSAEVIGPFPTREHAARWEDRYLDAPEGSRATFVEVVAPWDYVEALEPIGEGERK